MTSSKQTFAIGPRLNKKFTVLKNLNVIQSAKD